MHYIHHNREMRFRQQQLVQLREKLLKLAIAWTHDFELAEDLVQESLLKALKTVDTLRDEKRMEVWVVRILRNCWWDYLRRKKTREDAQHIIFEEYDIQLKYFHQQDIAKKVRDIVSALPTKQREVLTLADFAGFSYAEITSIVEIPIGTVMSRLFAARKTLRVNIIKSEQRFSQAKLRCVK